MSTSAGNNVICLSCGSGGLTSFYRIEKIPVHSCLLMKSRQEAVEFPRGDLDLVFCEHCGFIQNSAFDAGVHDYSPMYEETQGFSARFRQFASELAADYIEEYSLQGKSILEIGCGKGEFLVLMCEIGNCTGIGIDPGYRPDRLQKEEVERIEFIQDFYSEKYAHLKADMVLCRHTLEHIQPVGEFMSTIRRAIGDREETLVSFELPDTERILDEQAFWDIYYEHCSYFSLGSLARLFKSSGFGVLKLSRAFDDQYLLIDARPGTPSQEESLPGENDMDRLKSLVGKFKTELPKKIRKWQEFFSDVRSRGQKSVIWGSGSKAVAFLTTLGLTDEVTCITDINPYRHGMFMPGTGHEIVPPAELANIRPDVVVAMNPIYLEEIEKDLREMDLKPKLLAV